MTVLVIALVVVLIATLVVVIVSRGQRSSDDIDSFRRQIDALSPEARRPTIDRMKPSADPSADDDGADEGDDGR